MNKFASMIFRNAFLDQIIFLNKMLNDMNQFEPDFVHIMAKGKIIKTAGPELAIEVEEHGYTHLLTWYDLSKWFLGEKIWVLIDCSSNHNSITQI